jgi:uncharacterized protein YndB with AHSA1/START domain
MAEFEATDQGLTITRVFAAPRQQVWREWTEPERFADWFGAPGADNPLDRVSMDVRVGGTWRLTMVFDGREIEWEGEYREVRPPERLAFTVTDQPGNEERDLCTVELTDLGDGRTEMRFEQIGGHMSKEAYERAAQGWGGFFDRVDERLAG